MVDFNVDRAFITDKGRRYVRITGPEAAALLHTKGTLAVLAKAGFGNVAADKVMFATERMGGPCVGLMIRAADAGVEAPASQKAAAAAGRQMAGPQGLEPGGKAVMHGGAWWCMTADGAVMRAEGGEWKLAAPPPPPVPSAPPPLPGLPPVAQDGAKAKRGRPAKVAA